MNRLTQTEWEAIYKSLSESQRQQLDKLVRKFTQNGSKSWQRVRIGLLTAGGLQYHSS